MGLPYKGPAKKIDPLFFPEEATDKRSAFALSKNHGYRLIQGLSLPKAGVKLQAT